jgi:hypothetical protein
MATTGSSILASDYNTLRTSISSILNTQYGQTLESSAVTSSVDSVSQTQLFDLFIDGQRTYVHQAGSVSTVVVPPITGNTIGAETSFGYNQSTGIKSAITDGTKMGLNDYQSLITDISNFDPATSGFPVGNFSQGTPVASSRSTSWGGASDPVQVIYHVITVTWASTAQRNSYFSAGGELWFSGSLTGGSGSKDTDWAALLAAMGTVKFGKYRLTASSGTPTPTGSGGSGYDSLTSTYRQLFIKSGSGFYDDNDYTIEGRIVDGTTLRFRISFNDGDTGTGGQGIGEVMDPIDESVGGTTTSSINTSRPDSTFVYNTVTYTAVSITAPTVSTAIALSSNNLSAPA